MGFLKGEHPLLWSKVCQDFALLGKARVKETPGVFSGPPCPWVSEPQHPLLLQTPAPNRTMSEENPYMCFVLF